MSKKPQRHLTELPYDRRDDVRQALSDANSEEPEEPPEEPDQPPHLNIVTDSEKS